MAYSESFPARIKSVRRRYQAISRHMPLNCGPQKLLGEVADQRQVAEAVPVPSG